MIFEGNFSFAQVDTIQLNNSAYRDAELLFQKSDWVNATAAFKKLTEIPQTKEPAFYRLAIIHQKNGKNNEALYYIDQALKLNPNEDIYVITKAQLLNALFKYNEAGKFYFKAIELNPKYYSRYKEALDFFKKSRNLVDVIRVCQLAEKQFDIQVDLGLECLHANDGLKNTNEVSVCASKLFKKYPNNKKVIENILKLCNQNPFYYSHLLVELFKNRATSDTSNIQYLNEYYIYTYPIQLEDIIDSKNPDDSKSDFNNLNSVITKIYCSHEFYEKNKSEIQKVIFYKNIPIQEKTQVCEIFFNSEKNATIIDSALRILYNDFETNEREYRLNFDFAVSSMMRGKYEIAQKYFLKTLKIHIDTPKNFNSLEINHINYLLLCILQNNDQITLNQIKKLISVQKFEQIISLYQLLLEKNYQKVIETIEKENVVIKDYHYYHYNNLLAFSYFKLKNYTKANRIWSNLNAFNIGSYSTFLLNAHTSFESEHLTEMAKQFLMMAYYLGQISKPEFNQYLKSINK